MTWCVRYSCDHLNRLEKTLLTNSDPSQNKFHILTVICINVSATNNLREAGNDMFVSVNASARAACHRRSWSELRISSSTASETAPSGSTAPSSFPEWTRLHLPGHFVPAEHSSPHRVPFANTALVSADGAFRARNLTTVHQRKTPYYKQQQSGK